MKVQKLKTDFMKENQYYQIVKRTDKVVMYSLNFGSSYEVFDVKVRKAREVFGKPYPTMEIFPSNEDFGIKYRSKAFNDRERAEKWYQMLIDNPI